MKQKSLLSSLLLSVLLIVGCIFPVYAENRVIETMKSSFAMELNAVSAVLMEPVTGEILYEQNPDMELEPASVTKIMSVLLIYEALDAGQIKKTDTVTASEYAASMGGSQIWLEYGEQMSVDEMLKAILVASANDCTVAMAEHIAGSEEAFTAKMNARAKELGMEHTVFKNCTGLPVEGHHSSARDIAIMTRELLKHDDVKTYTVIWMDSLRGGEFGLSNTNKLIRFYPGATGLKTGFTDTALYCMSATAERDGMSLIAAVMKAPTSDCRFEDAKKLLDYGFSNFGVCTINAEELAPLPIIGGKKNSMPLMHDGVSVLLPKGREKQVESICELPDQLEAPIHEQEVIGHIRYHINGEEIACLDIKAKEDVPKMTFSDVFQCLLSHLKFIS